MLVIAQTEYMTFRASAHHGTRVSTGRIKNRTLVEPLMAKVLTLDEVDLEGRTVLVRVDINSPLDPETNVFLDDTRIKRIIPTLNKLSKSKVVLLAHQSRPGKKDFTSTLGHSRELLEPKALQLEPRESSLKPDQVVGPESTVVSTCLNHVVWWNLCLHRVSWRNL